MKSEKANNNPASSKPDYAGTATQNKIRISDHAKLRFLERVMDFDFAALENLINTPKLLDAIDKLGNGEYPLGNGFTAVVMNKVVVTIK